MKLDHWKQNNPVDQLVTIVASLDGNTDNWSMGIISDTLFAGKLGKHIGELERLLPFLQGKEQW